MGSGQWVVTVKHLLLLFLESLAPGLRLGFVERETFVSARTKSERPGWSSAFRLLGYSNVIRSLTLRPRSGLARARRLAPRRRLMSELQLAIDVQALVGNVAVRHRGDLDEHSMSQAVGEEHLITHSLWHLSLGSKRTEASHESSWASQVRVPFGFPGR